MWSLRSPRELYLMAIISWFGNAVKGNSLSLYSCSGNDTIMDISHPDISAAAVAIYVYDSIDKTEFSYSHQADSGAWELQPYKDHFKDRTQLEELSSSHFRITLLQVEPGDSGRYSVEMRTKKPHVMVEWFVDLLVVDGGEIGFRMMSNNDEIYKSTAEVDVNEATVSTFPEVHPLATLVVSTLPVGLPANLSITLADTVTCPDDVVCSASLPPDVSSGVMMVQVSQETVCGNKETAIIEIEVTTATGTATASVPWWVLVLAIIIIVILLIIIFLFWRKRKKSRRHEESGKKKKVPTATLR